MTSLWAITDEGHQQISDVLARVDLNVALAREKRETHTVRAVELFGGKPMEGARYATVREGIAIIDVYGPIARRANMFSEISGATSVEILARDVTTALINPSIRGILMVFDTPGGEVGGVSELAAYMYAERTKPGAKPIWAYVDVMAGSAGYWLAAACGHIVTNDTAVLGSIGVVTMAPDPSKSTSKDITFTSSQSPNKRPDLSTEAGKAQVQKRIDDTADVFVRAVAAYRGMKAEDVIERFGGGGVRVGQHAVDAGMADALGNFEDTLKAIAGLQAQLSSTTTRRPGAAPARSVGKGVSMTTMTADDQALQAGLVLGTSEDIAALRAELEANRKALASARADALTAKAAAFVQGHLSANRILPAASEPLTRVYAALAASGDEAALADLTAFCAGLTPHKLTAEQVPGTPNTPTFALVTGGDPAESDEAKREATKTEFKQATPLGRQTLNQEATNGTR